jgi:hypothetical protein
MTEPQIQNEKNKFLISLKKLNFSNYIYENLVKDFDKITEFQKERFKI